MRKKAERYVAFKYATRDFLRTLNNPFTREPNSTTPTQNRFEISILSALGVAYTPRNVSFESAYQGVVERLRTLKQVLGLPNPTEPERILREGIALRTTALALLYGQDLNAVDRLLKHSGGEVIQMVEEFPIPIENLNRYGTKKATEKFLRKQEEEKNEEKKE